MSSLILLHLLTSSVVLGTILLNDQLAILEELLQFRLNSLYVNAVDSRSSFCEVKAKRTSLTCSKFFIIKVCFIHTEFCAGIFIETSIVVLYTKNEYLASSRSTSRIVV